MLENLKNLDSLPNYLTPKDLCNLLRISPVAIKSSIKLNLLPAPLKISPRVYRWQKADIIAFLSGGKNDE